MSDAHHSSSDPLAGLIEPELLIVLAAAIVIGPLAIAIGALLALLTTGRRLWLWAVTIPSLAGTVLLWPWTHHQLEATGTAIHRAHAHGHPEKLLAAAWPQLWPVWLALTTLAPLVALILVYRRQPGLPDTHDDPATAIASPRVERRLARQAATDTERTGDASGEDDPFAVEFGGGLLMDHTVMR